MTIVAAGGDVVLLKALAGRDAWIPKVLQTADVACANLEVPLTDAVGPQHSGIVLRGDAALVGDLAGLGFDVIGLANNHVADQGWPPLYELIGRLAEGGMAPIGAGATPEDAWRPQVREGVAFLAATAVPSRDPGHIAEVQDEAGLDRLRSAIGEARRTSPAVALLLHGGTPHEPRATDWQRAVARAAVEAGASAVFGAHAHAVQGVEMLGGVPVFYGLGSAVFQYRGDGWERFERDSLLAFVDLDAQGKARAAWLEAGWIGEAGEAVGIDAAQRRSVLERVKAAGGDWGAKLQLVGDRIEVLL